MNFNYSQNTLLVNLVTRPIFRPLTPIDNSNQLTDQLLTTLVELGSDSTGPTIILVLPGDTTRFNIPVISHLRPDGSPLTIGERVILDGDRYGATGAWIDGVMVSTRDWRSRRAWRPIKLGRKA